MVNHKVANFNIKQKQTAKCKEFLAIYAENGDRYDSFFRKHYGDARPLIEHFVDRYVYKITERNIRNKVSIKLPYERLLNRTKGYDIVDELKLYINKKIIKDPFLERYINLDAYEPQSHVKLLRREGEEIIKLLKETYE